MALIPQLTATINGVLTIVLQILPITFVFQSGDTDSGGEPASGSRTGTAYQTGLNKWTAISNDQTNYPMQVWAPDRASLDTAWQMASREQAFNTRMTGRAAVPVLLTLQASNTIT